MKPALGWEWEVAPHHEPLGEVIDVIRIFCGRISYARVFRVVIKDEAVQRMDSAV